MIQNEVQRSREEIMRLQAPYVCARKAFLATCRKPKWKLWRLRAVPEPPKKPNKYQHVSPKVPKEAQEGSQDHFDALMLKNAQLLEFAGIYDTRCMSELPKSSAKTVKSDPSEHFFY